MTEDRRKAYNKLHYEVQKRRNEEVEAFKKLNPERFAELLAMVKAEPAIVKQPILKQHSPSVAGRLQTSRPSLTTEEIDQILYDPEQIDIYVWYKDPCGKEIMDFKTVWKSKDVTSELSRQIPQNVSITRYKTCPCPACTKRLPQN